MDTPDNLDRPGILIVDDLRDVRNSLLGVLRDQGYRAAAAPDRAEALRLLAEQPFHVALVDVRLDERDARNEDGLRLMHDIHGSDPSVAIVIMTGYGQVNMVRDALQPVRGKAAPAIAFVEKKGVWIQELLDLIPQAIEQHVKVNFDLEIQPQGGAIQQILRKLRFNEAQAPSPERLQAESADMLRMLFDDCQRIDVEVLQRGFSGVAVLKVTPVYSERGLGEPRIAKIGPHERVENEIVRYKNYVQGIVGGHRFPTALQTARTRNLSGIVYTFAGLGGIQDFSEFYSLQDAPSVCQVITNLFDDTCRPFRSAGKINVEPVDLKAFYLEHLNLKPERLEKAMPAMLSGRHPFRPRPTPGAILFDGREILIDPSAYLLALDLRMPTALAIIHGDLYGHNILVDRHAETWLIDFSSTGRGPVFQDFAMFENFVRFICASDLSPQQALAWEQAFFSCCNLFEPEPPDFIAGNPTLEKAFEAARHARRMAGAFRMPGCDLERNYLAALLCNALKLLTVMDLAVGTRDQILISAALIAARMQNHH